MSTSTTRSTRFTHPPGDTPLGRFEGFDLYLHVEADNHANGGSSVFAFQPGSAPARIEQPPEHTIIARYGSGTGEFVNSNDHQAAVTWGATAAMHEGFLRAALLHTGPQ